MKWFLGVVVAPALAFVTASAEPLSAWDRRKR